MTDATTTDYGGPGGSPEGPVLSLPTGSAQGIEYGTLRVPIAFRFEAAITNGVGTTLRLQGEPDVAAGITSMGQQVPVAIEDLMAAGRALTHADDAAWSPSTRWCVENWRPTGYWHRKRVHTYEGIVVAHIVDGLLVDPDPPDVVGIIVARVTPDY